MTSVSTAAITDWHAHIYYDPADRTAAAALRAGIESNFAVRMGRWHDEPVGPHPQAMYQVAFEPPMFEKLVPWLALNRGDLAVLVHPETGNAVADHSKHALWLGDKLPLKLEILR